MRDREEHRPEGVSVHTGFPNPAADKSLHTLDFNQLLVRHGASTFMFRVSGSEWEGAGVFDGDIAIIDRALTPRPDDLVLWWDGAGGTFALSAYHRLPKGGECRGVVTFTIHTWRRARGEHA